MKTLIQTLFFFFLVTQICIAQWYQQNSGTTANLNSVHFEDSNNGWAVGDSGTILLTTNDGTDWTPVPSGTMKDLSAICFTDAQNGWAVGDSGIILKTTNGGTNWTQLTSGTLLPLYGICSIDANTGWVVGGDAPGTGIILKTTNGGVEWIQQFNAIFRLRDVYFTDVNTGTVVVGRPGMGYVGLILKTTDSGATWLEQQSGAVSFNSVTFTNSVTGFAVGYSFGEIWWRGRIFQTTNGGSTWSLNITASNIVDSYFNDVFFTDFNNGIVVGHISETVGIILRTTDAGANWIEQTSGTINSLNSVYIIDSLIAWAVGDNGTILHTTNGGVTSIEEEQINQIPTEFLLSQNYPNPFNPGTTFRYSIPQTSKVVIKVYDILGNEIALLIEEEKSVGTYELTWDAASLPSGVYFYRLKAGSFIETKKMLLLR